MWYSNVTNSSFDNMNGTNATILNNWLRRGRIDTREMGIGIDRPNIYVDIDFVVDNTSNRTRIDVDVSGTRFNLDLSNTDDFNQFDVDPDVLEDALGNSSSQNETNINETGTPETVATSNMNVTHVNSSLSGNAANIQFNATNTSAKGAALIAVPLASSVYNMSGLVVNITIENGSEITLNDSDYNSSVGYYYIDSGILFIYVSVDPVIDVFAPLNAAATPPSPPPPGGGSSGGRSSNSGDIIPPPQQPLPPIVPRVPSSNEEEENIVVEEIEDVPEATGMVVEEDEQDTQSDSEPETNLIMDVISGKMQLAMLLAMLLVLVGIIVLHVAAKNSRLEDEEYEE